METAQFEAEAVRHVKEAILNLEKAAALFVCAGKTDALQDVTFSVVDLIDMVELWKQESA